MKTKALFAGILACICLILLAGALPAGATGSDTISGVITADNYYVLYLGDDTGSNLAEIARWDPNPEKDWRTPQNFANDKVTAGSYLYVAAWNVA